MRDTETNNLIPAEEWFRTLSPDSIRMKEGTYEEVVDVNDSSATIPAHDKRCKNLVSGGCEPVSVISGERLEKEATGPAETHKIGKILQGKKGITEYLLEEDSWDCIWGELLIEKKGGKTFLDRIVSDGKRYYNFSGEMLDEMFFQLDRMITKYSSSEWASKETAKDLVSMFKDHKVSLLEELVEVQAGIRVLTEHDFLGPRTRQKMMNEKMTAMKSGMKMGLHTELSETRDLKAPEYDMFFKNLEEELIHARMRQKREESMVEERRMQRLLH